MDSFPAAPLPVLAAGCTGQSLEHIFIAIGDINERNLINIRELAALSKRGADQIETSSRQLAELTHEIHGLAARFRV